MEIYGINNVDEKKMEEIIEIMEIAGPPKIRVVESTYGYQAIEGSHRLEAAERLGIEPEFIILDQDEIINNHDLFDLPKTIEAWEVVEYVGMPATKPYNFEL